MSWFSDLFNKQNKIFEVALDAVGFISKSIKQGKPASPYSGRNIFDMPTIDFDEVEKSYKGDAYIRRATDKYVYLLFKEGWHLSGKDDHIVSYVSTRLALMAAVTQVPMDILMTGMALDLVKFHNAVLVKARVKGGFSYGGIGARSTNPRGPVGAYFRVYPGELTVERNEDGFIKLWRQSTGAKFKDFKPEDTIHIHMGKNPNELFSAPIITCVLEDAKLLRQIEDNVGMMIYRHLFPLLQYTVGNGTPGSGATQNEIETLRTEILNMPIDGAFVTTDRVKINAIKISVINAEPYLKYFENRTFTGLGVSQVAMGRGDTASRATAESMAVDMYDQLKAYQKVLASFITHGMINEILVEGGYQPLLKPEHKVELVFNEIDVDSLIKWQNHEIFKFTNNVQTWEETRKKLGEEAEADEERLYFNMITIPVANANALAYCNDGSDAANRTVPKNQHSQSQETTGLHLDLETAVFSDAMTIEYNRIRHDVLELTAASDMDIGKKQHEIDGLVDLGFQVITNKLVKEAMYTYHQGSVAAIQDIKQVPLGTHAFPTSMSVRIYLHINKLQADLKSLIKDQDETRIVSVFDSVIYRLRATVSDSLPRAYNLGYAMVARSLGVQTLESVSAGDKCDKCVRRDVSLSDLSPASIPPWHYGYCGCYLKVKGSG